MQLAMHFTACISISAFLRGTLEVDSGTAMSDCGPSSALKVHWNCNDCTPVSYTHLTLPTICSV